MLMDAETILTRQPSGALVQTLTAAVADTPVPTTKSLDFGAPATTPMGNPIESDFGPSTGEYDVRVTEAFTSGGSATVKAQLVRATDAALSAGVVVIEETAAIPVAELVAGYRWKLGKPKHGLKSPRYEGIRLVPGVAAVTGKFSAAYVLTAGTR